MNELLVLDPSAAIVFTASNGMVVSEDGIYTNARGDLAICVHDSLFSALLELLPVAWFSC